MSRGAGAQSTDMRSSTTKRGGRSSHVRAADVITSAIGGPVTESAKTRARTLEENTNTSLLKQGRYFESETEKSEIEKLRAKMQMVNEFIAALSADSEDPKVAEKIETLKDQKLLLPDEMLKLVSA